MEQFTEQFKEKHPEIPIPAIGKDRAAQWKSMSDAEKACFVKLAKF